MLDDTTVIFDDDFGDGLNGWTGLVNAGENFYPSLYPAGSDSPFSMIIDTAGGTTSATANATKRWHAHKGIVQWWIRFAWNALVPGGVEHNGLRYIKFALDWQYSRDGVDERRWWEVRYRHYNESGTAIDPLWEASDSTASTYTEIPDVGGLELGFNQIGKYDFQDVVMTIDTVNDRWVSLQINERIYHAISTLPIADTQPTVDHFENGANCVISVLNRTNNSAADPFVVVGRTRLTVTP